MWCPLDTNLRRWTVSNMIIRWIFISVRACCHNGSNPDVLVQLHSRESHDPLHFTYPTQLIENILYPLQKLCPRNCEDMYPTLHLLVMSEQQLTFQGQCGHHVSCAKIWRAHKCQANLSALSHGRGTMDSLHVIRPLFAFICSGYVNCNGSYWQLAL